MSKIMSFYLQKATNNKQNRNTVGNDYSISYFCSLKPETANLEKDSQILGETGHRIARLHSQLMAKTLNLQRHVTVLR